MLGDLARLSIALGVTRTSFAAVLEPGAPFVCPEWLAGVLVIGSSVLLGEWGILLLGRGAATS